jgi:hypothetical protein
MSIWFLVIIEWLMLAVGVAVWEWALNRRLRS